MSSSSQEIRQMQPVEVRVSRSTSSEKRGGRNCTHDHVPTSQIINNNNNNNIVPNCSSSSLTKKVKVVVIRYMECMKNHAASIGGNARDGCGEFMATTTTTTTTTGEQEEEEGEYALNCSACNCHRNFHRKLEILVHHHHQNNNKDIYIGDGGVVLLGQELIGYPTTTTTTTATTMGDNHNHHLSKENEEEEEGTGLMLFGGIKVDQLIEDVKRTTRPPPTNCKKRFRTKFSQEQKEKMLSFADKAGWKIQKLGDSVVNQFCQEIGIKRRVLKVWMHNNKHHHHHYISSTTST